MAKRNPKIIGPALMAAASVLASAVSPVSARAEECRDQARVERLYEPSATEMLTITGYGKERSVFGRATCVAPDSDSLAKFEASTMQALHDRARDAFAQRFRQEKSLGEDQGVSCRLEFGGIPEVLSSFSRPEMGGEVEEALLQTSCKRSVKGQERFAWASVDWSGLSPKVRCENIWLVGRDCGRAPSTMGPAVMVDRAPAIPKGQLLREAPEDSGRRRNSLEAQ